MPDITSRQNERIKNAVKLRGRRQRMAQGRFLIDGIREIQRALDAGVMIEEAFACESLCAGDEAAKLLIRLQSSSAQVSTVTEDVFAKLAFGDRAEGLVALASFAPRSLEDLPVRRRAPGSVKGLGKAFRQRFSGKTRCG